MTELSMIATRRKAACTALLRRVREIQAGEGLTESSLAKIKNLLVDLAAHGAALFPDEDFAPPDAQGRTHMLDEAAEDGCGLYLTINLPGKEAAPHDHGIWCVNAGISGKETQRFYRRTDDGTRAGFATIEQTAEATVEAGTAIAMMDHDIHGTLVIGDAPSRALALYGYALSRFPAVVFYHPQFNTLRTCASRRTGSRA